VWAFSIAFDGGNKSDTSYLDVRLRFAIENTMHNFHLVALPMRGRHTGENMFLLISEFLDVICSSWRSKLIGIATDGTSSMTGRVSGVVSRIHRECFTDSVYRVWCGAHQLDLVAQKVFRKLCSDQFVNVVMGITGHLRRQQNLISEMGSKCPRFIDTRWLSMGVFLSWIVANRSRLRLYFDEKKPASSPDDKWWIVVFSLHAFVSTFNVCLKKIQGLTTLLCEQKHRIDELSKTLIEEGYVDGPFDAFDENNAECVICGKFRVTYESARKFIQDQGPFVGSLLAKLEAEDHQSYVDAVKSIALLFANSVDGLSAIVAERNARNEPTDTLPPVLPHDLLLLRPHDFGQLLQLHDRRLKVSYTEAEIGIIFDEFKALKSADRSEPALREIISKFNHGTSFYKGWRPICDRFPKLCMFAGGLASVFPGTSTVESDFSVIGCEKDVYRTSLTDFSLEGILQSKQHGSMKVLFDSIHKN
jgi:hypothetical protein